jgi:predicted Abi (CAAX) family protease
MIHYIHNFFYWTCSFVLLSYTFTAANATHVVNIYILYILIICNVLSSEIFLFLILLAVMSSATIIYILISSMFTLIIFLRNNSLNTTAHNTLLMR